jgi:hypothetical protein
MPGRTEFLQTVGGQTGTLNTTTDGVVETDNYKEGGGFTVGDGTNTYPHEVNPTETIQELIITETGPDIRAFITTASGTTYTVHLREAGLALDTQAIESVEFKDPNNTGAATFGMWTGE